MFYEGSGIGAVLNAWRNAISKGKWLDQGMWDFLSWPAFIVLIGSLLAAWAGYWFRSPRMRRRRETLIFLGITISILGSFWASAEQTANERRIAELNAELRSFITGGDSFAYMTVTVLKSPTLMLVHQGKYPLYDLNVRIVDLAKYEKMEKQGVSFLERMKEDAHMNFGNLAPNHVRILQPLGINGETLKWNLFFDARSGFFSEMLRVRRIGNEWKTAMKVTRSNLTSGETKTLFEKIDLGYPLSKDGQVEWE